MIHPFAENIWLAEYPLKMLGLDFRRNVSVIRLESGELLIHSTGPFSPSDIEAIHAIGKPAWLVESMLRHDTFSKEGREAFPDIPFLAPEGFGEHVDFPVKPILPSPWGDEVQVIELQGIPSMREHVFFHPRSRTLIVADLVFNFSANGPLWSEFILNIAVSGHHEPGMSLPFKSAIKDEDAFRASIKEVLAWDFEYVIVGHGTAILEDGRQKLRDLFVHEGFA